MRGTESRITMYAQAIESNNELKRELGRLDEEVARGAHHLPTVSGFGKRTMLVIDERNNLTTAKTYVNAFFEYPERIEIGIVRFL